MTRQEFNSLSLADRLKWVYFEGNHITSIRYYDHKVILYLIKDFYVEVFYHNNESIIDRVEILDLNCSRMQFYSDQIKLNDLMLN